MEFFSAWMGPIGAICIGIMVLALFFRVMALISSRFDTAKYIKFKKLLNQPAKMTVYLGRGEKISDVRFVGFTDPSSLKGVPYQFSNLVVFETMDGRRVVLRANTIRRMEEQMDPDGPSVAPDASAPATLAGGTR